MTFKGVKKGIKNAQKATIISIFLKSGSSFACSILWVVHFQLRSVINK